MCESETLTLSMPYIHAQTQEENQFVWTPEHTYMISFDVIHEYVQLSYMDMYLYTSQRFRLTDIQGMSRRTTSSTCYKMEVTQ